MINIKVFVNNNIVGTILNKKEICEKLNKNDLLPKSISEQIKPMCAISGINVKSLFFEKFIKEQSQFKLYVFFE